MFGPSPARENRNFIIFTPHTDFSNMLVDICEYIKPRLTIVDAVEAMEETADAAAHTFRGGHSST
jgi:uncharacterized protein (DUF362 family)